LFRLVKASWISEGRAESGIVPEMAAALTLVSLEPSPAKPPSAVTTPLTSIVGAVSLAFEMHLTLFLQKRSRRQDNFPALFSLFAAVSVETALPSASQGEQIHF
jgi:hypothetical protein